MASYLSKVLLFAVFLRALLEQVCCHVADSSSIEQGILEENCAEKQDAEALGLLQRNSGRRTQEVSRNAIIPEDNVGNDTAGDQYSLIEPIERKIRVNGANRDGYVLEFKRGDDHIEFQAIAEDGGQIVAFKMNGYNILIHEPTGPSNVWGSTFWPSPQSNWGWPPADCWGFDTYSVEVKNNVIEMRNPEKCDFRVTKRFSLDKEIGAITLEYELGNGKPGQTNAAPWEITRLPPKGVIFFPSAGGTHSGDLPVVVKPAMTWFDLAGPEVPEDGGKYFGNSTCTWMAHATGETLAGNLLFAKTFPSVPLGDAAPGEGNVELYAMTSYTEMEQQGSYVPITREEPLTWKIHWHLHKLSDKYETTIGNYKLVDYVEQKIASSYQL